MFRLTVTTIVLLIIYGCAPAPDPHAVTIMSFNVENLFDAIDDPNKADYDYLPLAQKQNEEHRKVCAGLRFESWQERCMTVDWNEDVVQAKLEAVAAAILQVNSGQGPHIVALQEVENLHILERLRTEYLADAGYLPAVLLEGNDSRGIDVAYLSKLPLVSHAELHDIEFSDEFADSVGDTRGILQASFELPGGETLTAFNVHFPAPYHPTGMRVSAYHTLDLLVAALPDSRHVFAAGDFNTTSSEDSAQDMLDRFVRPSWTVSNDLCRGCKGTSYFPPDRSWSFLDMVLWRAGNGAGWSIRADSVHIANDAPGQVRREGTPSRFDAERLTGVSDHWPVVVTIEPEQIQ